MPGEGDRGAVGAEGGGKRDEEETARRGAVGDEGGQEVAAAAGQRVVRVGDHLGLRLGAGRDEDAGGAVGVGPGGDEAAGVAAQQLRQRNRSFGDGVRPSRGDDVPQPRQRPGQRAQIGRVPERAVLGRGDDGDGLGAAQQALRLQYAPAHGEGQRDRSERGQRQVGDDGVPAVGQLYADHVARADPEVPQARRQTSDLAVEGGVAELALGVDDGGAVQVGDLACAEKAVEVEVGAGAVDHPGAAEFGGQQVAQYEPVGGHTKLQGSGTAGAPCASRPIEPANRGSWCRSDSSVVTAVAVRPCSRSRDRASAVGRPRRS